MEKHGNFNISISKMFWLTLSKAKKGKRRKENIVNAQKSKFKDWIVDRTAT